MDEREKKEYLQMDAWSGSMIAVLVMPKGYFADGCQDEVFMEVCHDLEAAIATGRLTPKGEDLSGRFDIDALTPEATRVLNTLFLPEEVTKWALRKPDLFPYGNFPFTPADFEEPKQEAAQASTVTDAEKEKLLKQIGLLALGYSEMSGSYKIGDRPNANAIADKVDEVLKGLEGVVPIKKRGLGKSTIRDSIRAGLDLLLK